MVICSAPPGRASRTSHRVTAPASPGGCGPSIALRHSSSSHSTPCSCSRPDTHAALRIAAEELQGGQLSWLGDAIHTEAAAQPGERRVHAPAQVLQQRAHCCCCRLDKGERVLPRRSRLGRANRCASQRGPLCVSVRGSSQLGCHQHSTQQQAQTVCIVYEDGRIRSAWSPHQLGQQTQGRLQAGQSLSVPVFQRKRGAVTVRTTEAAGSQAARKHLVGKKGEIA